MVYQMARRGDEYFLARRVADRGNDMSVFYSRACGEDRHHTRRFADRGSDGVYHDPRDLEEIKRLRQRVRDLEEIKRLRQQVRDLELRREMRFKETESETIVRDDVIEEEEHPFCHPQPWFFEPIYQKSLKDDEPDSSNIVWDKGDDEEEVGSVQVITDGSGKFVTIEKNFGLCVMDIQVEASSILRVPQQQSAMESVLKSPDHEVLVTLKPVLSDESGFESCHVGGGDTTEANNGLAATCGTQTNSLETPTIFQEVSMGLNFDREKSGFQMETDNLINANIKVAKDTKGKDGTGGDPANSRDLNNECYKIVSQEIKLNGGLVDLMLEPAMKLFQHPHIFNGLLNAIIYDLEPQNNSPMGSQLVTVLIVVDGPISCLSNFTKEVEKIGENLVRLNIYSMKKGNRVHGLHLDGYLVGAELFEHVTSIVNATQSIPFDPGGMGKEPGETTREIVFFGRHMMLITNGIRVDIPFDPGGFGLEDKTRGRVLFRRGRV